MRVVQTMMQKARQAQVVEAEHRQRENHEDQRKAAEHPRVLQRRGEQRARERCGDARRSVGNRHSQHVGQRKRERTQLVQLRAFAGNDSGQDRNHGEDARREREKQPEKKKAAEDDREIAFKQTRDVDVARIDGEARRCRFAASSEAQRQLGLQRHVAHAGIGATLRDDLQVEAPVALHRDADAHFLAIGLDFTEKLVLVLEAARKLWRTQAHAAVSLGAETEPVAVQVIAVGDREMHFNRRCVQRAGVKAERLFGLEQVVSIASQLQLRRCRRAKQQYDKRREKSVHVLVSAATHCR